MQELTLEIDHLPTDNSSKTFNLVRLDDSNESFKLVPGEGREISEGLFMKVDFQGNGILELDSKVETDVKISGKRVKEVAQFQGNDLITIGEKEFLLCPQEGAVIKPNSSEEKEEKLKLEDDEKDENIGMDKQKRKNLFSLFVYGIFCMIIATSGFLLFMNSKISDYNRLAAMANLFQRKMARLLNQMPKAEVKPIQIMVEQLFKEEQAPQSILQVEVPFIKKKSKSNIKANIPLHIVQAQKLRSKPSMVISQKDREHILKEIEMLKLEYRLNPFHVRKSLQEMRDSISDNSLRRKIDTVLQHL